MTSIPIIGIGIPFGRRGGIDSQAKAHFDRVIADGGLVPSGLSGVNAFFTTVKSIYATADITTAISVGLDAQVLGYKLGAGAGTTLGQAAQKLYSCSGASGDVVQTTAASQPLLLVHSGANYWFGSGVAGNRIETPNASANELLGSFEIISYIDYSNNSAIQTIISKTSGVTNTNYILNINSSNILRLELSFGATQPGVSSSIGIGSSYVGWVRATRNTTNGDIIFYTSSDSLDTNIGSISWNQLGVKGTLSSGAINNPTAPLRIATIQTNGNTFAGKIYRIALSNSIGGAPVVDFNPNQYNAATSQTQWTSSTGEVWTINTATTNNALKGALVDRTYVMGNGTSMGMQAASLNVNREAITSYTVFRKYNTTTGEQVINELGNISTGAGKYLTINRFTSREDTGIRANVGLNSSSFTDLNILLKMATAINNINNANESLPYLINNIAATFNVQPSISNNTVAMNATGHNLLARNNAASLFANALLSCDIIANQEDNSTVRTDMYNYIKSINNNAF